MAKIVQGRGFRGVINYVLDKDNARLIYAEGVRSKDKESVIHSFITQSKAGPDITKPVAHISLDFSIQDKEWLTDRAMIGIALEYLDKMGYKNTQFIIARHHDTDHPHIHLVINRIDSEGKRISDKNERFRSTKVCMELTKKYGLYIANGKENVKRHRLKEPDKTKYGIYDAIKATLPKCRNWQELTTELKRQGITTDFRRNGSTDKIQGIRFGQGNYTFNGSQIDRSCSYSKIDFQLKQNSREQEISLQSPKQDDSHSQPSVLENVGSVLGGLFDVQQLGTDCDPDEVEFQR
ncbi:MAG: relaxase/mobilization nuclease domain-containing protein [Dysgonamonadaceae bacterium]|nr:relaxase/mobilization nuclease domain-containing protein [Dysgonamonadaceae bacterium]